MPLSELTLVHYGGHKKTVPIIGFDTTVLFIQWEGVWTVRVRTNRIYGMPSWHAENHEEMKRIHRVLLKGRDGRLKGNRYAEKAGPKNEA